MFKGTLKYKLFIVWDIFVSKPMLRYPRKIFCHFELLDFTEKKNYKKSGVADPEFV